jgi:hypothetical protein
LINPQPNYLKEREKAQINKIRDEKRDVTVDITESQWSINYFETYISRNWKI